MCEILFKGFHKNENGKQKVFVNGEWIKGEWVEGNIIGDSVIVPRGQTFEIEGNTIYGCDLTAYEVIPETVGQYTGLTDKNGTKIFEGNIIRYADYDEYRCYIESLDCAERNENMDFCQMWTVDEIVYGIKIGYPAFDLNSHDFESNGLSVLNESGQYYYEVIGNIHDNPELLGGDVNA